MKKIVSTPKWAPEMSKDDLVLLTRELVKGYTFEHKMLNVDGAAMTRSLTITVQPSKADVGLVVGKSGRNIQALEKVITTLGRKCGIKTSLKLIEPTAGKPVGKIEFETNPNWEKEHLEKFNALLKSVIEPLFGGCHATFQDVGDDSTIFEVQVPSYESNDDLVLYLGESLATLFEAVGRTQGREIQMNVFVAEPSDDEPELMASSEGTMPASAAGRFCGEIDRR